MKCPRCGCIEDKVIDSRSSKDGLEVRRRRECLNCMHRFSTEEHLIPDDIKVIKKNSVREDFQREKLRRGIANACYKRPVSESDIEHIVDAVSGAVLGEFEKEVPSSEIGRRVMAELRRVDQVAYVRFASVYRKFKDVEEFIEEIRALK